MISGVRTLIFDWDGTLHRTAALYGHAVRCAYSWLVSEGYAKEREITDEETSVYLGMNAHDMWECFMPELEESVKRKAEKLVGSQMDRQISEGHALLYDGAEAVLNELKIRGYNMIILSNCRHAYMEEHRRYFQLDKWFSDYYAAEDYGFVPKQVIFESIKEKYQGPFCVIGDRDSDILTARVHNLSSIGCLYGYGSKEELKNADVIVDSIGQITSALN